MCPKRRRRLVPGLHGDLDMADPAAKLREYRDVLPLWLSITLLRGCSDQSIVRKDSEQEPRQRSRASRNQHRFWSASEATMPRGRREAARPRVPRASRPPPTPSVTASDIIAASKLLCHYPCPPYLHNHLHIQSLSRSSFHAAMYASSGLLTTRRGGSS